MVLQKMSSGAKKGISKVFLLGFLFAAVAGLVLTDVQGFFRGGMSVDTVAKGGGVRISTQEFDRTVRRVLTAQGIGTTDAYRLGLIEQILHGEIQSRLMANEARELGLVIGDEAVMEQIAQIADPIARTSGITRGQAMQQALRARGIGEQEFINSIRQEVAIELLRTALVSGADTVPDDLARAIYRSERETRAIEAIVLAASTIEGVEEPDEESLRAYYEANKADYATYESRNATIAILSEANLEDRLTITEKDLRDAYERNIANYKRPAQREVEQAVFADQGAAENIFKQVKEGASLQGAAGDSYLGKNAFAQSGLMPEIAGPVFDASAGDVVGPIQSPLGWHVIVVGADIAEQVTAFENVKNTIERDLRVTRLMDELINAANELDDRLAGGEALETLVNEYSLTTQKVRELRQSNTAAQQEALFRSFTQDAGDIIDTIFSYEQGEIAPVMELRDGRFIAVRIDDIMPTVYKEFDAVKAELKNRWLAEQRGLLNRARAQDALAEAEKGTAFAEIAAANKSRVQAFSGLTRTESKAKAISPVALARIFSVDKDGVLLAENNDDIVVVKVTGITLPDASNATQAQLRDIKERIAREQASETLMQYVMNRGAGSNVKINAPLLRRLYGGEG